MGGNKSKPIVESARKVINRRIPPNVSQVKGAADQNIVAHSSQPNSFDSSNDFIDPNILKTISKWSIVKSSSIPTSTHIAGQMASTVRFEEEKRMADVDVSKLDLKDRLKEEELVNVYRKIRSVLDSTSACTQYDLPFSYRDDPKTYQAKRIAEEFNMSFEIASVILKVARMPNIIEDAKDGGRKLAT